MKSETAPTPGNGATVGGPPGEEGGEASSPKKSGGVDRKPASVSSGASRRAVVKHSQSHSQVKIEMMHVITVNPKRKNNNFSQLLNRPPWRSGSRVNLSSSKGSVGGSSFPPPPPAPHRRPLGDRRRGSSSWQLQQRAGEGGRDNAEAKRY